MLVKRFWNLCSLFVEPSYHRRGIDRGLMQEAVRQCEAQGERRPYVRVNSAPNAVDFYRSLGFTLLKDAVRKGTSTPMVPPLRPQ